MFKRLLGLLKLNNSQQPTQQCSVVDSKLVEHRSFTETGEFIKADEFEQIWIYMNRDNNYRAIDILNDNEYLDYYIWQDMNTESMYKKHRPNSRIFRGKNPNIIFHAGCLGCLSQRLHGIERCKGCIYFRFISEKKPNLHIEGEDATKNLC